MNGVKRPGGPSGISAPGQGVRVTNTGLRFSGDGVRPQKGTPQPSTVNTSHPSWGGLPGKAGPDRSNGSDEEKIYAYAQGIRGGVDADPGQPVLDQTINPQRSGKLPTGRKT